MRLQLLQPFLEVLAMGRGPEARDISSETAAADTQPVELSDFYPSLGNCLDVTLIV